MANHIKAHISYESISANTEEYPIEGGYIDAGEIVQLVTHILQGLKIYVREEDITASQQSTRKIIEQSEL